MRPAWRDLIAAACLAGALLCVENDMAQAQELRAGTAVADITPPVGGRMCGYFYERLSTGTADPLLAKALVLRQGEARAAMVFCDIIGIAAQVAAAARREAEKRTGIPADNILVAATHSHTGPLYSGALREHFHNRAVAAGGRDACESVDYAAKLTDAIVRAIAEADAAAAPVRLAAGTARQEGLSFNRRFHMADGTVRFNPGPLNPDIRKPAGPVDPNVGVVLLTGQAGPAAALVNFALHLDTRGGTEYSADYPLYVQQVLRESLGKDLLLLFGTGTCGDLNHIDVTKRERAKTEQIGRTLGQTVAAAARDLPAAAAASLAVRREVVTVPLQRYDAARLARARADMDKIGTREMSFLDQVETYKIVSLALRGGETVGLEVQVFRLGADVAVVGLPGEVFVELGLAIKKASPFRTTLVIELCNDSIGYVPTKKAFAEGSYETVNSRIAPGGGEKMVEAAVRLLKELGGRGSRS